MKISAAIIRRHHIFVAAVWLLRLVVGGLFLLSGFAKSVDLWGFVFKLEEYIAVWNIDMPRTLLFIEAMVVAGFEFVMGAMLMMGCYKRFAPWALTAMMALLLPLTAYIYFADPVADCGCFGEMWHLSNGATFLKNILLTAALVWLDIYNRKVRQAMFNPSIQWIAGALVSLYILAVGLYGYVVQPMLDFRSFPIGTPLTDGTEDFDGELTVYDTEGEDISAEVFAAKGDEILIVIPELQRADLSLTYYLNEFHHWADTAQVPMVALIGAGPRGIAGWQDVAMTSYPCFQADDTQLRELARGNISVVLLRDGRVLSKTDLSSYEPDDLDTALRGNLVAELQDNHWHIFLGLTVVLGVLLLSLYIFQGLILALRLLLRGKLKRK